MVYFAFSFWSSVSNLSIIVYLCPILQMNTLYARLYAVRVTPPVIFRTTSHQTVNSNIYTATFELNSVHKLQVLLTQCFVLKFNVEAWIWALVVYMFTCCNKLNTKRALLFKSTMFQSCLWNFVSLLVTKIPNTHRRT